MRTLVLLAALAVLVALPVRAQTPATAPAVQVVETRPRLLLVRDDLPRLRIRCGVSGLRVHPLVTSGAVRFGSHQADFERLRRFADASLGQDPLPGSLYAPALMHLITGTLGAPDKYTAYVASRLVGRLRFGVDSDDAVVALDWCYDAIPPDQQAVIKANIIASFKWFEADDSPFNHVTFHTRLCSLAAAITFFDPNEIDAARRVPVAKVIADGARYLEGPFVRTLAARGAMATSPAAAALENADACFAAEIWRTGTGRDLWPRLRDSLSRAAEPYFWSHTEAPDHNHGFLHDDGSTAPPAPGLGGFGFTPATALVLARQAGDAVAASYVNRRPRPPHRKPVNPPAFAQDRHVWTKLIYHEPDRPTALRPIAPLARNFGGGWVLMRSSWRDDAVILLWDAGQPFFRSRQHFDAGHFQIYRRGLVARGAGTDVALEAARSKGGQARIADRPADWDLYAQATIAHNCMTVYDPLHVMTRYGQRWPARGNQRIIEGGYRPSQFETRRTGRLLRFETNAAYSYAAADLADAYAESHVLAYTRQVLLLNVGLVVVCDRIESADPKHVKTWHLQLPNRPTVDGAALPDARRIRGTDDAGIWQFDAVRHALSTTSLDGRLFVQTLEPPDAQWRVIGGPKSPQRIPEGTFAGREYFGGDPDGFEHWLVPSHAAGRNNATYRLGKPTRLGPQFGLRSVWGRLDVQAPTDRTAAVFVHLLTPAEVFARTPARTQWQRDGQTGTLTGTIGQHSFRITLTLAGPLTGTVTLTDRPTGTVLYEKPLTDKIEPNAPVSTTAR